MPTHHIYEGEHQEDSPDSGDPQSNSRSTVEVRLFLEDLSPDVPSQQQFWPVSKQHAVRIQTLGAIAETLANRYPSTSSPLLLSVQRAQPEAIFSEERYRFYGFASEPTSKADSTRDRSSQRSKIAGQA
jgi:hypothetical protein